MYLFFELILHSAKRNLLYLNLMFLLLIPLSGHSQKDLRLHLLAPVIGQDIIRYHPFNFKVKIENTDILDIKANDIVEVSIQLFGNYVYSVQVPHNDIEVGDSIEFNDEISFNFSAEYHNEEFCAGVNIINNSDPTPNDANECYLVDLLLKPTATFDQLNNNDKLVIFPNPSNGLFHLKNENTLKESLNIKAYDLNGRCIFQTKSDKNEELIDLTDEFHGLYHLVISGSNSIVTKNIVIE